MRIFLTSLLCILSLGSTPAWSLIIETNHQGWYNDSGGHTPENTNYIVGRTEFEGLLNNFFVFDLGGLGTVTGATLRAYLPFSGFFSSDPSETWVLYDVDTDIGSLVAGTAGPSAFIDLGTGTSFGEVLITAADGDTFIEVDLNANALASLSSANGLWAIGGTLPSLGSQADEAVFAFTRSVVDSNSQEPAIKLELVLGNNVVPTPSTMSLFLLGFVGMYARRRRTGSYQSSPHH